MPSPEREGIGSELHNVLAAAEDFHEVVAFEADGEIVHQHTAGIIAHANSRLMLFIRQLKDEMLRQSGNSIGEILLEALFGGGADLVAGHFGMQTADHGAKAVLDGYCLQLGVQAAAVLGEHFVTGQQNSGHAHLGAGPAVQQKL